MTSPETGMPSLEATERRDRQMQEFDQRLATCDPKDRQVECLIELTKQVIELNYILEDIAEAIGRIAQPR